jgi:hypothetical protein
MVDHHRCRVGAPGTIILFLATGHSQSHVGHAVGVQRTVVLKRARRFLAQRLDGLTGALNRDAKGSFPPALAIHVGHLACECQDLLGRTFSQWDCTELARPFIEDISAATIRHSLAAHQLKPWRHHLSGCIPSNHRMPDIMPSSPH